jgi:hypothetical protein
MNRPAIVKRKFWFEYPLFALQGLACILDGLIILSSCGFVTSGYALEVCKFRTSLFLARLKKLG